jgi:glycosyltransferase involved in cell wall biosynthesis
VTIELPMTISAPNGSVRDDILRLARNTTVRGPLVSCLMVSRGRRFPALFAIDCYRRQTYANRELVIVTGGQNTEVGALVRELDDPTIRYIEAEPRSLGELRNTSVAHARGLLVCHWDDDDFSHADRIALQVAALGVTEARACVLSRLLLWWPARQVLRLTTSRLWEGSILADRAVVPIYPAWPREEDLYIVTAMTGLYEVVSLDCPNAYCYIVHGKNTNKDAHFEGIIRQSSSLPDFVDYNASLRLMENVFPFKAYESEAGK